MIWALVLLGLSVAAFCVRTAIRAYRAPIRHPWWWTFVCLVCAPVSVFNLTTGQLSTQLLSFNLFGFGYWHGLPAGPTIVQVAFPAGAALFLGRRRHLIRAARPLLAEDRLPG
jgi:hypothetical protein